MIEKELSLFYNVDERCANIQIAWFGLQNDLIFVRINWEDAVFQLDFSL